MPKKAYQSVQDTRVTRVPWLARDQRQDNGFDSLVKEEDREKKMIEGRKEGKRREQEAGVKERET